MSEERFVRLSKLDTDQCGVITKVNGHGSYRRRVMEMGFVVGQRVRVIKSAPLLDPVEYEIMGYRIALRRAEASMIEVDIQVDSVLTQPLDHQATFIHTTDNRFIHSPRKNINVALVGNPNSGKTSLFNLVSGLNERVGNYSGVTVGSKSATKEYKDYAINLSDLPGTYSIAAYSPEELFVRQHIFEQLPDVVINVVDASNLERNMLLTTQLIDMNIKVVIALNMYDELQAAGSKFDYQSLGRMIGIPIIPTVASRGAGIDDLLDKVIDVFNDNEPIIRHIHINYGVEVEQSIKFLQDEIWKNNDIVARYSSRYLAIKLLQGDGVIRETLSGEPNFDCIDKIASQQTLRLERIFADRVESVITGAKYGFIAGALGETLVKGKKSGAIKGDRIDSLLTHRLWGLPIFLAVLWLMFQTTFTLGGVFADGLEYFVGELSLWVSGLIGEGVLNDLLTSGVIQGVGGVLVFLPNILLLFFFISVLEDTGYMARVAFIMDRLMHKIGLHGKSFMPMLMGFGCNVPAIMATRTLESRKDRLVTMMAIPFFSCSARLPIYVLLISAFFVQYQGLVLVSVYLIGVLIAILTALMLSKIVFKKEEAPFVMELPPYRIPTARSVVKHMWSKGSQYLKKMGSVILIASVLIWALGYFPRPNPSGEPKQQPYIEQIGRAIEPAIEPLGFDWQIGVSLVTGLAAKEVIISTMAVLNGADEENAVDLEQKLKNRKHNSGEKIGQTVMSPLVAFTMMIFVLLYFPCVAAIATIRREAGMRWAWFTVFYTTALAWIVSFAVFQIGQLIV